MLDQVREDALAVYESSLMKRGCPLYQVRQL
jgi:hypothetical protein